MLADLRNAEDGNPDTVACKVLHANVVLEIVQVPVAAPKAIVVATPNAFTVVAVVLHRVTVASPLEMLAAASVMVQPAPAPMLMAMAAPAKFTVVAAAFTSGNVVCVVVMPPEPFAAIVLENVAIPVTPRVVVILAELSVASPLDEIVVPDTAANVDAPVTVNVDPHATAPVSVDAPPTVNVPVMVKDGTVSGPGHVPA